MLKRHPCCSDNHQTPHKHQTKKENSKLQHYRCCYQQNLIKEQFVALIVPRPPAALQINNHALGSAALLINTVQEMEHATLSMTLSLNHMVEEMGHSPLFVSLSLSHIVEEVEHSTLLVSHFLSHMVQEMEAPPFLCHFLSHMWLVITSITIPTQGNK